MAKRDPIGEIDKAADYNTKHSQFYGNDVSYYGEYESIPIPANKEEQIREAVYRVNELCQPTVNKLSIEANVIELQDRVYNRIQFYTNDANRCILDSRTVAEVNVCCDAYIHKLRGDFFKDAVNILKDY